MINITRNGYNLLAAKVKTVLILTHLIELSCKVVDSIHMTVYFFGQPVIKKDRSGCVGLIGLWQYKQQVASEITVH